MELNDLVAGEGKESAQKAGGAPWKPMESAVESNIGGKAGLAVQRPEAAEQREKNEAEQPGETKQGASWKKLGGQRCWTMLYCYR